ASGGAPPVAVPTSLVPAWAEVVSVVADPAAAADVAVVADPPAATGGVLNVSADSSSDPLICPPSAYAATSSSLIASATMTYRLPSLSRNKVPSLAWTTRSRSLCASATLPPP